MVRVEFSVVHKGVHLQINAFSLFFPPQIRGMTCSSCVHSIESNVKKRAGVLDVSVALTTERGKVKFDPTLIGERNILYCILY